MSSLTKTMLRKEMKVKLQALSSADLVHKSNEATLRAQNIPSFSSSTAVSIFLSMPAGEILTDTLLNSCFDQGKRIFIPKVTGKRPEDMIMVEVASKLEMDSFPKSKWGIPEPPEDFIIERPDGTYAGCIDLVFVPGVAFDVNCSRLGHGKGYYDCFLERVSASNVAMGLPPPITIGMALDEQIVSNVPIEPHDR